MPKYELFVNKSKCEVITDSTEFSSAIVPLLQGSLVIKPECSTLLGAPIGSISGGELLRKRVDSVLAACNAFRSIRLHDALFLLQKCSGEPKLMYHMRCSIPENQETLQEADDLLRSALSALLNIKLDSSMWRQATLPLEQGGLGLPSVIRVSHSAFLASCNKAEPLIQLLLGGGLNRENSIPEIERAWEAASGAPLPSEGIAFRQAAFLEPIDTAAVRDLDAGARSPRDLARLLATHAPHSAAYLTNAPRRRDGTRLDDAALKVELGLRLGAEVASAGKCECSSFLDPLGDNALSCKLGPGRGERHQLLNPTLREIFAEAGHPSQLEPVGLIQDSGKRADGATVLPYENGRILAWDATCVHTTAVSWLPFSSRESSAAAAEAESRKTRKYSELKQRCDFAPFAVETFGAFGPSAVRLLERLAKSAERLGHSFALSRYTRRLSAAIQLGNAACILHAHSFSSGTTTHISVHPNIALLLPSLSSAAAPEATH